MQTLFHRVLRRLSRVWRSVYASPAELDALYRLLHEVFHDLDDTPDTAALQTQDAFDYQWKELADGEAMLSDPWFKDNVTRILSEEELRIKPEWFKGKNILDCGCGNGRWSYGFAKLGANVTAVDISQAALDATAAALNEFDGEIRIVLSPLEALSAELDPKNKFDLVFSRGVLHHCRSFTRSLSEILKFVKEDGLLYLYLYGRQSYPLKEDLALFRERILYNSQPTAKAKEKFLLNRRGGDRTKLHQAHDYYAPLINRRFEFTYIEGILKQAGFAKVEQTMPHTELFVRAVMRDVEDFEKRWSLPVPQSPYWFDRYS